MKKTLLRALIALLLSSCVSAPYTGRRQLMLVDERQELAMGQQAYREILRDSVVSKDSEALTIVRRVGGRIAQVANKPDYKWIFNVFNYPETVNAFCVPGGEVGVYSGIFPIAKDEAGLAVILGHEIAHALLRHSGERMSQTQVAGLGMALVGASGLNPGAVQALGLGAQYGLILPYGRTQESEADHVGLILMAKAGYDPRVALDVWERMARAEKGAPPEFLSTHPGSETRMQQLREWMPEAFSYYQPRQDPVATLPSPQSLDSPAARAERELQKRIQAINSFVEARNGERPIVEALSYQFRLNPQTIVQERQQLRIGYGQYTALRALASLSQGSISRIVSDYRQDRSWTEIAESNGRRVDDISAWLGQVIRATNDRPRQLRSQPYRPNYLIR
jgi:Zn-dependent protease with chaperone function